MKFCLVNGVQQSYIDIESRGLAYGDGVFTTAKIQNGRVHYLKEHVERLINSCKKLSLTPPEVSSLTKQLSCVAKNYPLAVLKVIISASKGGRGYARASYHQHDIIIMIHDYPQHYDELAQTGIKLGISKQQLGLNPMLAGLKHLNRLEQVLLRQELSTTDNDDLLVTNINDEVIETLSANVFYIKDNIMHTPTISHSGVNGIYRQAVVAQYSDTVIKPFTLEDFSQAQTIFTCNCVSGVIPVAEFNGHTLDIEPAKAIRELMIESGSNND